MYTLFFYLRFALLFSLPLLVFAETSYEPNNTLEDATPLYVNGESQDHKFDYAGDQDWLVFYAEKGTPYNIEIESDSIAQEVDPVITLYNSKNSKDGIEVDLNFSGEGELLDWPAAPDEGFYYIQVTNKEEFSINGHYKIKIFLPFAPLKGQVHGKIIDQCTKKVLGEVKISAENVLANAAIKHKSNHNNGGYSIPLNPGNYSITARRAGYKEKTITVTVKEAFANELEPIELSPEGGCTAYSGEPPPDPEVLKQQAVGIFNESSGMLTIKEVRVGNKIYTASLKKQANFNFKLDSTSLSLISQSVTKSPAFFNHDSLLVEISKVFAFNQLFSVQLKRMTDELYILEKAEPL
jgi:hypothetical protein